MTTTRGPDPVEQSLLGGEHVAVLGIEAGRLQLRVREPHGRREPGLVDRDRALRGTR